MKKIAYIIPGYCESHLKQRAYNKIAKFFEECDIEPIHVEIDWGKNNPERFSDYTKQFINLYKKPRGGKVYVLGFSYGATVAFLTAARLKPDAIILCSLSPYFEEDFGNLKASWVRKFKKNFTESIYSFEKLASKVRSRAYLIVGDKDYTACLSRSRDAKKKLPNASLSIAVGAKHNISQKEYLAVIKKVILKI